MNNIIDWDIPWNYIESVESRGIEMSWNPKVHAYVLYEDEAFIIATYFTNVWLHAYEHNVNVTPGTFPSRSCSGEKLDISLGRYEISLQFNTYDIDEDDNWYTDQWLAYIVDKNTNDQLELNIESTYDYEPGFVYSERSEKCAKALAKLVIRQCQSEFGYPTRKSLQLQLRLQIANEFSKNHNNIFKHYPEWFSKNLYGERRCALQVQG